MPRQMKSDFDSLITFLNSYSLGALCTDTDFVKFLSTLHKKFYAYLVLVEEMRPFVNNSNKHSVLSTLQFDYLRESVSDCGQALFLSINGCYKGARLLLRSSIENFLKGICLDEVTAIVTEKSVYQVFDDADAAMVFKTTTIKADLHSLYSLLCQDVHTADVNHMTGITALKFFPHYDKKEADQLTQIYIQLLPLFISAICIKFRKCYHSIEYENKGIIAQSQMKKYKAMIMGE